MSASSTIKRGEYSTVTENISYHSVRSTVGHVPGKEKNVQNGRSLSRKHQKRKVWCISNTDRAVYLFGWPAPNTGPKTCVSWATDGVDGSDGEPRPDGPVATRALRPAARGRAGRRARPSDAGPRPPRPWPAARRARPGRARRTAAAGPPLHGPLAARDAHVHGSRAPRGHILVLGERRVLWSFSEPALLTPVRKMPVPIASVRWAQFLDVPLLYKGPCRRRVCVENAVGLPRFRAEMLKSDKTLTQIKSLNEPINYFCHQRNSDNSRHLKYFAVTVAFRWWLVVILLFLTII